jgi:bifunctional non-homologous end joining protein LigD
VTLPKVEPMELMQQASPFDHDDWIFEIKHDGFRALAYIEDGKCKLVSRNDFDYKRFADLRATIPSDIKAKSAILDGELVVLDREGKSHQQPDVRPRPCRLRRIRSGVVGRSRPA